MFLRSTSRWKDGKKHYYWSIVENRRCRGDRIVQQTVLYLREINDSQREQWIRAIEVFDEDADAAATKSSSSSWSFLEAQWEFGRRSLYGLPTSKTDNDSLESLQHQS